MKQFLMSRGMQESHPCQTHYLQCIRATAGHDDTTGTGGTISPPPSRTPPTSGPFQTLGTSASLEQEDLLQSMESKISKQKSTVQHFSYVTSC